MDEELVAVTTSTTLSGVLPLTVKYGMLAVVGLYMLFAAAVIKQINLMVRTVRVRQESALAALGWIHLGVAALVAVIIWMLLPG
jgi:hypothetical protein